MSLAIEYGSKFFFHLKVYFFRRITAKKQKNLEIVSSDHLCYSVL